MKGTGLDSPLWVANWGRTARSFHFPKFTLTLPTWHVPTLDREDKLWLLALAGLVASFVIASL